LKEEVREGKGIIKEVRGKKEVMEEGLVKDANRESILSEEENIGMKKSMFSDKVFARRLSRVFGIVLVGRVFGVVDIVLVGRLSLTSASLRLIKGLIFSGKSINSSRNSINSSRNSINNLLSPALGSRLNKKRRVSSRHI
jgi:hypothetical protein